MHPVRTDRGCRWRAWGVVRSHDGITARPEPGTAAREREAAHAHADISIQAHVGWRAGSVFSITQRQMRLTAHGDLPDSLLRPTAATKATVAPDSTPSATTPSCHMLLVAHLHLTKLDLIELRRPWRLSVSGGDLQWIKPQKRFALAQLQR